MNQKLSTAQLGRMAPDDFRESEKHRLVVVLENIRSGLNVGSIFRSADAFRIEKIICCGYTPVPPHREILKSALGATQTVAWEYAPDALDLVNRSKSGGAAVYAIEQTSHSTDLRRCSPEAGKPVVIIFGNEVTGVSQPVIDACDGALEVAQHGTKHSLNVAVCAGIVLFDVTAKMQLARGL